MSKPPTITFPQYLTDPDGVLFVRTSADSDWVRFNDPVYMGADQAAGMSDADQDLRTNPDPQSFRVHLYEQSGRQPLQSLRSLFPSIAGTGTQAMEDLGPAGRRLPPIDPNPSTSIPPPAESDDEELPPAHRIMSTMARPVSKVAGSRRPLSEKAKGKQRTVDEPVASASGFKRKASASAAAEAHKKIKSERTEKITKGRAAGAANYSTEDLEGLFDLLEEYLPLGGNAWNTVGDEFNKWAEETGRPAWTAKSLELKFKQLVKTSKPTGDAECPPHVLRAHEIDDLMNEKAGTRDLDDDDIVDADVLEVSSDSEAEVKKPSKASIKKAPAKAEKPELGPVARRAPMDRLLSSTRKSRNATADLMSTLSLALDPQARHIRQEESTLINLQSQQVFQLNSQLRESQRQLEGVRSQLAESERRCHAAERRADRAEDRLEFMGTVRTGRVREGADYQDDYPRPRRYPSQAPLYNDWSPDSPSRHRQDTSQWQSPRRHSHYSSPHHCYSSPPLIRPPSPYRSTAPGLNSSSQSLTVHAGSSSQGVTFVLSPTHSQALDRDGSGLDLPGPSC